MLSRLLFNPISFLAITGLSIIFSLSLYKSTLQTKESSQELATLEQEVSAMEENVAQLKQATSEAQQPFTKEKIIRNELLMQKPGEYVVQITETQPTQTEQASTQKTLTPWEEWKALLW